MAAEPKLKKYKLIRKLKKKENVLDVSALSAPDANGHFPLFATLEKCGYKNCFLTHGVLGVSQAGSFNTAYQAQDKLSAEPFNIYSQTESGEVDLENFVADASNLETILKFREAQKAGMTEMLKLKNINWEGRNWKVVNRQAREGDKGGMIACTTVKLVEPVRKGYFLLQDENGADYWQLYDEAGNVQEGQYTYTPRDCYDVVVGGKMYVTKNQVDFDAVATKSGTPYDGDMWPTLLNECLGREVQVDSIVEDSDWPGYNVNVTVTIEVKDADPKVVSHVIPIRALRVKDPDATALMLGEVGMWVLSCECKLFDADGYAKRADKINPLVNEIKGIMEHLSQTDDVGFMEIVDPEDNEEYYNLKEPIQAWCNENSDWSYDNH